ncbi:hypothetical protein V8J88_21560 [Massilia sp. W12]|uniref:hypothetical protein n=1 Tax=Massilia sp. W12 TaxID=3126507 RepID=UPI0030D368E4
MPPPPASVLQLPFLLLIVLEVLAVVCWPVSFFSFWMAFDAQAMPAGEAANGYASAQQLSSAMLRNGMSALACALGASWPLWRYFYSRRVWMQRYFEFNEVHLRACQNARGDWLLYWPDVLQAAELRTPAQQQRVSAQMAGQGALHGAAPHYYVTLPALWAWLLRKKDRLGIRFTQYLAQTPQFTLDDSHMARLRAEIDGLQQPDASPPADAAP